MTNSPEEAARGDVPPRYASVVAREQQGDVAVILLRTNEPPHVYPYEVICRRQLGEWEVLGSSNGPGHRFLPEGSGLVTYWDEAPRGSTSVRVAYKGNVYDRPVKNGHFLFVFWDAPDDLDQEEPTLA